ncbi:MAG: hypothetical protein ACLFSL_02115 [Candidatus Woesearchaeota archaeon]
MWKCVVDSSDLKTYELSKDNLQVCIEARQNDSFWEIYKTYRSTDLTFTEEYEASSHEEANDIIGKMKNEIIDERTLKRIDQVRKNLEIKVKRTYKEENVEKWKFAINSDKYENAVIIRYSDKDIEMDIIANERFKFIETELLDEVFRILGMSDFGTDVIQNIYFFSKKSSFFNDADEKAMLNRIEVGFRFESENDFNNYFDPDEED